ncbi:MAG: DNA-directed RNA polymerase subunit omega [Thermoanaerobaculia bacterium]
MDRLPPGVESKFRYVLLIAKRAEHLIEGSPAKSKSKHSKPTRIAMEEVNRQSINWSLTPPPPPEQEEPAEPIEE